MRVDDILRAGGGKQRADRVSLIGGERGDLAPAQEPPELDLPARTADLCENRSRDEGDDAKLESHPVLCPHLS